MEDSTNNNADERPLDMGGGIVHSTSTAETVESALLPRRKSQGSGSRHKREVSVDMLAGEHDSSAETGHLPTVPENRAASLLDGAYQTPESGTSATDSSSGLRESSGVSSVSSTAVPDLPPIDEQIRKVTNMCNRELQEGQKGFIISTKWLARVLARGSDPDEAKKYSKEAMEGPVGPVDNSGLYMVVDPTLSGLKDEKGDNYIPLRPNLAMGEDYQVVPQDAWELIVQWYGLAKGSAIIVRYCHNTSPDDDHPNMQYEIYPPIFTILKLPDKGADSYGAKLAKEQSKRPAKILASRHDRFQDFLKRLKNLVAIDLKIKVRIWKVHGGLGDSAKSGILTPAQSRSSSPAPGTMPVVDAGQSLVIDVNTFAKLDLGSQRESLDVKDETSNDKYNGHSTMDVVGLRGDDVLVLEEQIQGPAGGEWVSENVSRQHQPNQIAISLTKGGSTTVKDSLKPRTNISSGRTSPAPASGMMTRGRSQKAGKTRGTIGLGNLGNTCYMNSALQCIRSVEELTQYFLAGKYKGELNIDNPLGHHGAVAKAYANLLNEMYGDAATTSFTPRGFKNVIARHGQAFSGYGQQDSQEFLLFLLDGLQEDLNRIRNKPYIEKPDSTDAMVNDPVALRGMAERCWEIYKARNDSVVTDLFAGMYKSTVVCPVCNKVSIIFDPFNNLTLQLPIENIWSHPVLFFPRRSTPLLLQVDIDKNSTFMGLKEYVAKKVGAEAKKMVVLEIYKSKFYKLFSDGVTIGEERIQDTDTIAIYELDCPLNDYVAPPKKKKPLMFGSSQDEQEPLDHPTDGNQLVAVFNRVPRQSNFTRSKQYCVTDWPFLIAVAPEEAQDYEEILRKVLGGLETLTTRDFLRENGDSEADSDVVVMSTEDTDSSSESKVHTKSIESEDGMVDISMRDAGDESQAVGNASISAALPKAKPLAPMLRPGASITPEVQSLFDIKVFAAEGARIPTGFNIIQDENRDFPRLRDRHQPEKPEKKLTAREKLQKRLSRRDSPASSDEDAQLPPEPALVQDSGSESDGLPPVEQLTRPNQNGISRFNKGANYKKEGHITYSRKGNRLIGDQTPDQVAGNCPLINAGEALILDWTPESWDALFGGIAGDRDEQRGLPTWEDLPVLPDPDRDQRRKVRESRKKHGITLEDCLDEFGKPETLSENDAWYCPRCKEHRLATKTFELWKAPDVLVIHLKRFSTQGRLRDKLDVHVDFPVEGLDLSSRVSIQDDGKSSVYDLFAVDNHYGGLGGGHYTAFAKNFLDDTWYEYNDTQASRRNDPQRVVTSAAYLLFYRRRASGVLGGPFFERLLSGTESGPTSQPSSRTVSPSGEGQRLDDSSRTGSSSAFQEAGATHQAGGGGLIRTTQRTGVDDDLPAYGPEQAPFDNMDVDEDEGIGMGGPMFGGNTLQSYHNDPAWSFDDSHGYAQDYGHRPLTQTTALPPGSDEDLFEGDKSSPSSMRVAKSESPDEDDKQHNMQFLSDEGTTSGFLGTPEGRTTPEGDILIPDMDDEAEAPILRVRAPKEDDE